MTRKPLVLDLTQAAGVNTVPLDIRLTADRVLHFEIPERTDVERARMVQRLETLTSDDQTRDVTVDWLMECAASDVTREEARQAVQRNTALSQVLAVLLSGRLPDPKVMDRLMSKMLDRMAGKLVEAI
ncbi:hypothetical protein CBQ26_09100 [Deinococcus indicus]|uniref:Uncharacterized protein n=1 Tax=Deinococcus indicus TaxID=223556 RepID=A0A2D0A7X4_9DEIO|nr:hypothetical protein [Deinococcus indicus]OWL96523.1 hypothetical protein CBQ26_09100 [Deinococcus indicus]